MSRERNRGGVYYVCIHGFGSSISISIISIIRRIVVIEL